jgi:metal-dependent hydrolase (beta-lactamase superfamily II)
MDRLRIEPNSLDGLVLSRGERKELDALRGFLSSTNRSLKKNIDVVVGAEPLPAGLKKIASPIALESENLMSAAATGRCRVLAEQSFVVDSAQSDPTPLRSDDVTSAEYRREPENAAAQLNSISTSFVLMEKGLVIIMSSNESAADCVRAVQAASEVCDVHAIIGMNIGVGCSPAKTQKILSELLEFGPAHILVSADTVGPDFNLVDAAIYKKIVRCSPATRIVFR